MLSRRNVTSTKTSPAQSLQSCRIPLLWKHWHRSKKARNIFVDPEEGQAIVVATPSKMACLDSGTSHVLCGVSDLATQARSCDKRFYTMKDTTLYRAADGDNVESTTAGARRTATSYAMNETGTNTTTTDDAVKKRLLLLPVLLLDCELQAVNPDVEILESPAGNVLMEGSVFQRPLY